MKIQCIKGSYLKDSNTKKSLGIKVFAKGKTYEVLSDKCNNAHTIDDAGNNHCVGEMINNKIESNKWFDEHFIILNYNNDKIE